MTYRDYREIKTTHAGVCAKCKREIKINWTVFYSAEKKAVLCKPCYAEITKTLPPPVTGIQPELQSEKGLPISQVIVDQKFNEIRSDINALRSLIVSQGNLIAEIGKMITPILLIPNAKDKTSKTRTAK